MDASEFRTSAREMIDIVTDYLENIRERPVFPDVAPGYLGKILPARAPEEGEAWEKVKGDLESVIMSGVNHWQSPNFHAYFPIGNSYPSILGSLLTDGISTSCFSWNSCPVGTELEITVMNWLADMIGLPEAFHFHPDGKGGGTLQGSASEATLIALLSARSVTLTKLKEKDPALTTGQIIDRLVAYTSEEGHSSIQRAALYSLVEMRILPVNDKGALSGPVLRSAIEKDIKAGLVPFFVCATIGSTGTCASDNLTELGPICNEYDIWLHVDAAYAGSACICPEFRYLLNGIQHVTSFNFDPHKWLRVNFECSAMWVKDTSLISDSHSVSPVYLKDKKGNTNSSSIPEFRHWQVALGRRFRSLKVWFVLRMFGVKKLQNLIRKDVELAKLFEKCVKKDDRFEMVREVTLGLASFRLKVDNEANERLCSEINKDRRIHLVPSKIKETFFLRFAICAMDSQESDVTYAWSVIQELADKVVPAAKCQ